MYLLFQKPEQLLDALLVQIESIETPEVLNACIQACLEKGETEINGRLPINTDGGCIANGEPIGASGLRQVYENVLQLRGDAGARQVPNNPKVAYTHVYGAPGISGVTILAS